MKSKVMVRMRTCFFHNILFWIKSMHHDLFLSTGYCSVWDPVLCLPSQQEWNSEDWSVQDCCVGWSGKNVVNFWASSSQQHLDSGRRKYLQWLSCKQLSSDWASPRSPPPPPPWACTPACRALGTWHGFWNGDALGFLCPCIVSNEGKIIFHPPQRTDDQHSDGFACILAAKRAGPSKI